MTRSIGIVATASVPGGTSFLLNTMIAAGRRAFLVAGGLFQHCREAMKGEEAGSRKNNSPLCNLPETVPSIHNQILPIDCYPCYADTRYRT